MNCSIVGTGYTCNRQLFAIKKPHISSKISDSIEKVKPKKKKRKRELNCGEEKTILHHKLHSPFITAAYQELRAAFNIFSDGNHNVAHHPLANVPFNWSEKLNEKAASVKWLQPLSLERSTHLSINIINQPVCNVSDEACLLKLHSSEYVIPAKSQFILSDFSSIENLTNEGTLYDLIVIDPPWENKSAKRCKRYDWLPHWELLKIPVADLIEIRGFVVVWLTNKPKYLEFVREQLFVKWNVQEVALWHWIKVTSSCELTFPMDSPHKKPYEPFIIGRRLLEHSLHTNEEELCNTFPNEKIICSVPSALHSQKPPLNDVFMKFLPVQPNCLELFARSLVPHWTSWGNETIKFQDIQYFQKEDTTTKT